MHETDVQYHIYSLLKDKFHSKIKAKFTIERKDLELPRINPVRIEASLKGIGMIDIAVIDSDNVIRLEAPTKSPGAFYRHHLVLSPNEPVFGIEIKYNRNDLKNNQWGNRKKMNRWWNKKIEDDLWKLTHFKYGWFLFVSNRPLEPDVIQKLENKYSEFRKSKGETLLDWHKIRFYYCDPKKLKRIRTH